MVTLETPRSDTRAAFISAREVLRTISRLSPQAQRYLEILTSFGDAVEAYHSQLQHDRPQTNNQYLEQIFRLEVADPFITRPATPSAGGPSYEAEIGDGVEPNTHGETGPPREMLDPLGGLGFPQGSIANALSPDVSDDFQVMWDAYSPNLAREALASDEDLQYACWQQMDVL